MNFILLILFFIIHLFFSELFFDYNNSDKDVNKRFLRLIKTCSCSIILFFTGLCLAVSLFSFWEIDFIQNGKFLHEPFESNINIYTEDVQVEE